jgi:hypothetical protein
LGATIARELTLAKSLFGHLSRPAVTALKNLLLEHNFSVAHGDLMYFGNGWYVTHAGLLRLAQRRHCCGIHTRLLAGSDPAKCRWLFKATVYKSQSCRGFVPLMFLRSSMVRSCALQRPERSIGRSVKHTE